MTALAQYQIDFIRFALQHQVLKFGEFTLKSGRNSPYFFNAGQFNSGESLAALGRFYAAALANAKIDYDVLFGPAYKGIPLGTATAVALSDHYQQTTPFCFNRKEKKDHGEGGSLVGAPLEGRVMVIDDVITAGTAIRESMDIISANNASLAGVVIALDRQEKGTGELSAIQEIEQQYHTNVISIITLSDLLSYLQDDTQFSQYYPQVKAYQQQYGI